MVDDLVAMRGGLNRAGVPLWIDPRNLSGEAVDSDWPD